MVLSHVPDPDDLISDALTAVANLAIDEGIDHHRFHNDSELALPQTLVLHALDALIDLQIRHPEWTGRLSRGRFFALEGALANRDRVDQLVQDHPLAPSD